MSKNPLPKLLEEMQCHLQNMLGYPASIMEE